MKERFPKEVMTEEQTVEQRIHDMRQEFTERHQAVLEAEKEKVTTIPYDYHYADLKQNVIEKIDVTDFKIREEIKNIHIEDDVDQVRKKFDDYFLELDPEKKGVAVILYHEFAHKQAEVLKKRK